MFAIYETLRVLKNELEQFLKTKFSHSFGGESVHISSVVDEDNKVAIPPDSVGLSLVHLTGDGINRPQIPGSPDPEARPLQRYAAPPLNLDVYVLFCAHFQNYEEALRRLSAVIGCFQTKSVFEPDDTPGMPAELGKISLNLFNLTMDNYYNMWSVLGSRYLPSVLYQIRPLTIDEKIIASVGAKVEHL